jgi:hypothetical protein
MQDQLALHLAISTFFEQCLKPGQCYGSSGKPFTVVPNECIVVYQDGIADKEKHIYSDVMLNPDGTYFVSSDVFCTYQVNETNRASRRTFNKHCSTLIDVFNELIRYPMLGMSTCLGLLMTLSNKYNTIDKIKTISQHEKIKLQCIEEDVVSKIYVFLEKRRQTLVLIGEK